MFELHDDEMRLLVCALVQADRWRGRWLRALVMVEAILQADSTQDEAQHWCHGMPGFDFRCQQANHWWMKQALSDLHIWKVRHWHRWQLRRPIGCRCRSYNRGERLLQPRRGCASGVTQWRGR
jgi:hypothetical protein